MALDLTSAAQVESLLRMTGGAVAGAILGINRDLHHKPAGLRTHALVGLGASVITILSISLAGEGHSDSVLRVVQGVITGIGFLGAGVILHPANQNTVFGLTTAASVWLSACLGMVCGAGNWGLAILATGLALIILVFGGPVERMFHRALGGKKDGKKNS